MELGAAPEVQELAPQQLAFLTGSAGAFSHCTFTVWRVCSPAHIARHTALACQQGCAVYDRFHH